MRYKRLLLFVLCALSAIGFGTIQLTFTSDVAGPVLYMWGTFLVLLPLSLADTVWTGWAWAAMACVVYGTIGLALDLSTITSVLGGKDGTGMLLGLSGASAMFNLLAKLGVFDWVNHFHLYFRQEVDLSILHVFTISDL